MSLYVSSRVRVLLLLFLLTPTFLFAGFKPIEPPIFQGKIINQKTKEAIPFATIRVVDFPGFGTVSDAQGDFQFQGKENWPKELTIKVSFLGFQNKEAIIETGKNNQIILTENVKELKEVVVIPDDFERNLMRQVIDRIPQNYPNRHERIYAVTQEQTYKSPYKETPLYKLTANVQADVFSYAEKNSAVNVEVLNKDIQLYPDYISSGREMQIVSGAYNLQRFDLIGHRSGPFKLSNIPLYDFSIQDTLVFDNQEFIVMDFISEDEGFGKLYINSENLGVKKIELEITDFNKDLHKSINASTRVGDRKSMTINVEYLQYPDGLYRFQYSYYTTYFVNPKFSLFLENIFTLQEFEEGSKSIPMSRQLRYSDPLLSRGEVASKIRDEYLICISEPDSIYAYVFSLDPETETKKFKYSKLSSQLSLGSSIQSWNSFTAQVDTPFEFESSKSEGSNVVPLIGWELFYGTNQNTTVYFGFIGSFQRQRYHRHEIGIEKLYRLSKKSSSRILLGAAIGRQRSGFRLDDLVLDENTEIRNRNFTAGETFVFTRQRELVFTPKVGFLLGSRNVAAWQLSFEFPLAVFGSSGLFIREQDGGLFNPRSNRYLPNTLSPESGSNRLIQNMPVIRLNYRLR